jgi:hypothetical protein
MEQLLNGLQKANDWTKEQLEWLKNYYLPTYLELSDKQIVLLEREHKNLFGVEKKAFEIYFQWTKVAKLVRS